MASSTQMKVVLLGEGCVGKTSLLIRYCQNKFNETHETTLQVSERRRGRGDSVEGRQHWAAGCLSSRQEDVRERRGVRRAEHSCRSRGLVVPVV
jgi:GTPase SAR1 family protein